MTVDTGYPLQQALPADVLAGGNAAWSRYRQYPVFSWPWLKGRSLLFIGVIAPLALLAGVVATVNLRDYGAGLLMFALQFAAFTLMATTGPALATWVRHRRWQEAHERRGVVVAVLLGIMVSFVVDYTASAKVVELVELQAGIAKPSRSPEVGPLAQRVALVANLGFLLLVYGLFGGGMALRAYFSERSRWLAHRQRLELDAARMQARDADLRLGVLQAQVEPHFLFNTLASVRALVRQEPAQAEATLDALSDFLRATIPRLREGEAVLHSTLGQQLDICTAYLAVMQVRMGGRLHYGVQCDQRLREQSFPPALLITLVENAIKHGIEPRPGEGRVEIAVERLDGRLQVQVSDDGAGFQPGPVAGLGLHNVRAQLAQRYGEHACLRLRSRPGSGVIAEVEVPWEPEA